MAVDVSALFGNFDPIGAYAKGAALKKGWDTDAALKETFSNMPVGPNGKPDFMTAAQKLFAVGATGPGLGLAQLAQAQADKDAARQQFQQTFGLQQQRLGMDQKTRELEDEKLRVQNERLRKGKDVKRTLTPVYGTDDKGNTVLLQPGDDGTAVQTQLPAGVKIASGLDKVDGGTEWLLYDKRTGQLVSRQPKDIVGKEEQEALGAAQGKKLAALPQAIVNGGEFLKHIDNLASDPNLGWSLGATGMVTRKIPGTPTLGVQERIEQLRGKSFLEAYEALRGGGAITEAEGTKATNAFARLNAAQSEKDFRQALKELREVVETGLSEAKRKMADYERRRAPPAQATPQGAAPEFKEGQRIRHRTTGQMLIRRNGEWVPE